MLIPLLLGSSALAFAPSDDVYIGIEPQRVLRFHSERQHDLRHGDAWQDFVSADGDGWHARFDEQTGTVFRAWGPGIDMGSPASVAEAAGAVLDLLSDYPDLLGVGADALALGMSGYDAERDTYYIHLDRVLPGTSDGTLGVVPEPVSMYRSGITARIKYGKLILLGIDTHPDAPQLSDVVALSRDEAAQLAVSAGPHPDADHTFVAAKKVVLPLQARAGLDYRMTWEVRTETQSPRGIWVSYIDADTGELLNVHNEVRYASGTVEVEHNIRHSASGTAVSVLKYLDYQGSSGADGQTDDAGYYSTDASSITAGMSGGWITVSNQQGGNGSLSTAGDATATTADFSAAELNTYHFLTEVIEWAEDVAPNVNDAWFYYYDTVVSNVNINSNCNAYYDGNVNFYRAGGGCNNTGEIADVIYHEWGHGFHYLNLESGNYDGSVGEGVGDTIASFFTNDTLMAPYFQTSGSGIREFGTDYVYPDDYVNNDGYVHANGRIFSGALWDFRTELTSTYPDDGDMRDVLYDVFVGGMKGGPSVAGAYDEFVVADDDDGDLGNGTPHLCELIAGFSPHGLGPGGSDAVIELSHAQVGNQLSTDVSISADFTNLAEACSDGDLASAAVVYSVDDGGSWDSIPLDMDVETVDGIIPAQEDGTVVEYYIEGTTTGGNTVSAPEGGSITPITYYVGELIEVFCTDFEDDDGGFTSELLSGEDSEGANDWMRGTPGGLEGDPAFAYSGDNVWGNDLGGRINGQDYNGAYQSDKHNRLLSPALDVSAYGGPFVVQFQRWLTVEDGYYDTARVTVNDKELWNNHATEYAVGDEHHKDSQWALHTVLADEPTDGILQVGWEIESDGGLEFGGWNIDDFCVYATSAEPSGGNDTDDGFDDDIDNGGDSLGDGNKEEWSQGCSTAAGASGGLLAGLMALGLVAFRRRDD